MNNNGVTDYNILHLLDTTEYPAVSSKKINMVAYQINREGLFPFLQFFLLKNKRERKVGKEGVWGEDGLGGEEGVWGEEGVGGEEGLGGEEGVGGVEGALDDLVSFPVFDAEKHFNGCDLLEKCSLILDIIFLSYSKIEPLYKYTGKLDYNSETYMFFDCSEYNIQVHALKNDIWLTLVDEIINYKSIYKYAIDPLVYKFFLNNLPFLYLTNIDTPIVAYIQCPSKKVDFISIFGQLPDAELNGYYRFTSYDKATATTATKATTATTDKQHYIRFALFPGNMNLESDLDDFYDSFFVNGEWILKEYNRQITLSTHY